MVKNIVVLIFTVAVFLLNNNSAFAEVVQPGRICDPIKDTCTAGHTCKPWKPGSDIHQCEPITSQDTFGTITPPEPLQQFIGKDTTGKEGISKFLSNLVALFYGLAGIVLIFMLLWGAWDWMTSEGDKEKLDSARKKIINAIVGIILFAVAFAIIQVLGQFTGFQFFTGQKP